jgi:hypothetical protein
MIENHARIRAQTGDGILDRCIAPGVKDCSFA